jgi:hypothetical protein
MTTRKNPPEAFDDIEKPHPVVAESIGDAPATPLTVRLGDLWSDFLRAPEARPESDAPQRPSSPMPLLDEMKGIRQWD